MVPTVEITPELETDDEGEPVVLHCMGAAQPPKIITQLVDGQYIHTEWYGPDEQLMDSGSDYIIGESIYSANGVKRSLTITEAKVQHAGLYTCKVTITLPDNETLTSSTQYHLILLSELVNTWQYTPAIELLSISLYPITFSKTALIVLPHSLQGPYQ